MEERIRLHEAGVTICDVQISNPDVADFLREVDEAEREQVLIQAIEIGIYCLERARTSRDTEFVRRQIDALLQRVQAAVAKIPEDTQKALIEKIGTEDSQALAPLRNLVNEVAAVGEARLREVRTLLSDDIDPSKENSTLGKALKSLRDLLDPQRTDSVQGSLSSAIADVTGEGGALAAAVKAVVAEAVSPLSTEVNRLAKQFAAEEQVAEALEQTTAKGAPYEEEVVGVLQEWVAAVGGEVHHVGADNKPGDALVHLGTDGVDRLSIVVEARYRGTRKGRKAISDDLAAAMAERDANAGVYVSRTLDGLAKEIGDWAEGDCDRGRFVACTHDHLITAVRFLAVQERLARLRTAAPEVDAASIEAQLQRIRTSLDRVKTINRHLTSVHDGANEVQSQAEAIRAEVRDGLFSIEDALRVNTDGSED